MKRRSMFWAIVVVLMVFSFYTFGFVEAAPTKVLKLAHVNTTTQPIHLTCVKLAELVAERTNNRVQINVYPASQLGSNPEIFQGVKFGTIEMGVIPPPGLSDIVPGYAIFDAGYVFRDLSHFQKVVNGPIGESLTAELVKKGGIRVLGIEYLGTRHLTTSKKPIYKPEDLAGLKIRAVEFPIYVAVVNAMGGSATTVAFQELFGALQSGIVDGQENPIPSIWAAKMYEVQKYLMLTGHIMAGLTIAINERTYQGLSSEDRQILQQATKEAIAYGEELLVKSEKELLVDLKSKGMVVIGPEQGLDVDAFRKRVITNVLPQFESKWGKGLYEKIQNVK